MSVAKNIEITSSSTKSFEDAIDQGIKRATKSLNNVQGAWIKEQKISITNGEVSEYRVMMILTFILDGDELVEDEVKSGDAKSSGKSGGKGKKK
jgi:flavin-binding protein dodecin